MSSGGHVYKEGNSFLGLVKKLRARAKAAGKSIYSKLITYPNTLHTLPRNIKSLKDGWSAPGRDKALGEFCLYSHTLWLFFFPLSLVISSLVIMADIVAGFMYLGKVCIFMWDDNQAVICRPEIILLLVH